MTTQQLNSNEKFLSKIAHASDTYIHTQSRVYNILDTNTNINEKSYVRKAYIADTTQAKKKNKKQFIRHELNENIS